MNSNKITIADNFQTVNVNSDQFSCIYLNIRSLKTNFFPFLTSINKILNAIKMIILVETNISDEEQPFFNIQNFKSFFFNRKNRRGGGIAIFVKNDLVCEVEIPQYKTFESMLVHMTVQKETYDILAIYRPPSNTNTRPFCKEFSEMIDLQDKCKHLIIAGDFNIDVLKNNCYVSAYLDLISNAGLKICNEKEYTRIDEAKKSRTNIDHILIKSRKEVKQINLSIVRADISDHFPIYFAIPNLIGADMKKNHIKMKTLNEQKLNEKVNSTNWAELMMKDDPESLYEDIVKCFEDIYNDSYEIKNNVRKNQINPWFTREIFHICKKRDQLYKQWIAQRENKTAEKEYKLFRNKVNKKIIWAKNQYYKKKLDECEKDARKTWKVINEILGKKTDGIDEFLEKNMKQNNTQHLANKFAEDFNTHVKKAIHDCAEISNQSEVNVSCSNSIFIAEVSEEEVYGILGKINTRKGPGLDLIRPKEIKNHRDLLYPVIYKLIKLIMQQKKIPIAMKTAMVRPIFKSGIKMDTNNYRPISIMSSIEKVFEEILCSRLNDFIKKFNIIDSRQYGFQKGKSMNLLLGNFASFLNTNLSKNLHTFVLFLDFTKAFDTIPHKKLLDQMERIGIRGECLELFQNYLTCRTMVVKIFDKTSDKHEVRYGVPQGSKLGPIMFLIFANSLLRAIKKSDVFAYADDTAVAITHRDAYAGAKKLQDEIRRISLWCHDSGLVLNATKTKIMHIRAPHIKRTNQMFTFEDPCPQSNGRTKTKIEIVKKYKYLGIMVDEHLKWHEQIDHLRNKLRSAAYILKHLSYCSRKEVLLKVYYAIVESYLRYGITAWGSARKLSMIKRNQNGILKILKNAKIETLPLKLDNLFKLVNVSEYYDQMAFRSPIEHKYTTRRKTEGRFKTPKFVNTYGKFSLPCLMPRLLNLLPRELLNIRNKMSRRKLLKKFFEKVNTENRNIN